MLLISEEDKDDEDEDEDEEEKIQAFSLFVARAKHFLTSFKQRVGLDEDN